jgi:hypothetical protein
MFTPSTIFARAISPNTTSLAAIFKLLDSFQFSDFPSGRARLV